MFQWHAGNVACKVLMMIRTGGYILSSNMLIVLSVDRFITTIRLPSSNDIRLPSVQKIGLYLEPPRWCDHHLLIITIIIFCNYSFCFLQVHQHQQSTFFIEQRQTTPSSKVISDHSYLILICLIVVIFNLTSFIISISTSLTSPATYTANGHNCLQRENLWEV